MLLEVKKSRTMETQASGARNGGLGDVVYAICDAIFVVVFSFATRRLRETTGPGSKEHLRSEHPVNSIVSEMSKLLCVNNAFFRSLRR